MSAALYRFLSTLTFGGMLGGGIAGFIHAMWLTNVPGVPFVPFVASGILLGSALHRPLDWYWRQFLGPIATVGNTMIQVRKLQFYLKRGLITPEQFADLIAHVIENDVIGRTERKRLPGP